MISQRYNDMDGTLKSSRIKAEAMSLGFSACGLARAKEIDGCHQQQFQKWLQEGKQAGMDYMKKYEEIRFNPSLLLPNCRTVMSVALSYYPQTPIPDSQYQLAYYAYGKDYHDVIRNKLTKLVQVVTKIYPSVSCRICVDTAPIMERYWAVQAGLGWIGKNRNLIIPRQGSFVLLGELLLDKEADSYDTPVPSLCGSCNQCIAACPNHAIHAEEGLDAHRCLSYLTIEHRGSFSLEAAKSVYNQPTPYYIYGCDRCQLACPHNRKVQVCLIPEFQPSEQLLNMKQEDWHHLTPLQFQQLFRGSAVKRAKYEGLMRNINQVP